MDIPQLKTFVTVAREGSITRTSASPPLLAAVTEGAPLWSDVVDGGPGESYDVEHGVAVGAEGHVHVVGHVDPDIYHRTYRKYASTGELLCSLTLPAPDPTSPTLFDVALDGDGFPLIVGYEGSELFVARLTP